MDLASHALVGGLVASAGVHRRYGSVATATLVAASLAPDLDGLLVALGPQYFFEYHRGPLTHSVGGAVLLSAALAGVVWRVTPFKEKRVTFGLALVGTTLHLAGDLLTSWPFPVLFPISDRKFSADLIGFLDPILLGTLAAGAFAARRWPARAALVVGLTLLASAGYLGARVQQRESAAAVIPAEAQAQQVAVLPEGFGLTTWDVITQQADGYTAYRVDAWQRTVLAREEFRSVGDPRLAAASRASPLVRAFLTRARFPVYTVREDAGETKVEWRDAQLDLSGGLVQGVRVVLDEDGRIIDAEFTTGQGSPSRKRTPETAGRRRAGRATGCWRTVRRSRTPRKGPKHGGTGSSGST